jgi:cytochrome c553
MMRFCGLRYLLAAGLYLGASAPAMAESHSMIPEPAGPPVVPEAYAAVQEQLSVCFDCHDASGYTPDPAYPNLSGQEMYYLYVQLKDFKAGRRASEIMGPVVSELERDQMKMIAQYFSEQPWPNIGFRGEDTKITTGERATAAGQCVQCHLGSYMGNSRVPRLAGQYPGYLLRTMADFKTKSRANSPAKSSLMESYSDADLAAMAEFLADM